MLNTILRRMFVTRELNDIDIAQATSLTDILEGDDGNVALYHFTDLLFGSLIDAGLGQPFVRQGTAPTDTTKIWLDNSVIPNTVKVNDGSNWIPAVFGDIFSSGGEFDVSVVPNGAVPAGGQVAQSLIFEETDSVPTHYQIYIVRPDGVPVQATAIDLLARDLVQIAEARIDANELDIEALQNNLASEADNIDLLQAAEVAQDTRIAASEVIIAGHDTEIAQNAADILLWSGAQGGGVFGYQEDTNLPTSTGGGNVAYVGGTNSGVYVDFTGGWIKISDLLPNIFDTRLSAVEENLTNALLRRLASTDNISTQVQNGAQLFDGTNTVAGSNGDQKGFFIPLGQDGDSTRIIGSIPIEVLTAQSLSGQTADIVFTAATSDNFMSEFDVGPVNRLRITFSSINGVSRGIAYGGGENIVQTDTNELRFHITHTFTGLETEIRVDFSVTSNDPVVADTFIDIQDVSIIQQEPQSVYQVAADAASQMLISPRSLEEISDFTFAPLGSDSMGSNRRRQMNIKSGEDGINALWRVSTPLYKVPAGARVEFVYSFISSPDLDLETQLGDTALVRTRNFGAITTGISRSLERISPTEYEGRVSLTTTEDAGAVEFLVSVEGTSSIRTTDGFLRCTDIRFNVIEAPEGHTRNSIANRLAEEANELRSIRPVPSNTSTIALDGTGDNTSIVSGLVAMGGGQGPLSYNQLNVKPGLYLGEVSETVDIDPLDWTSIVGFGHFWQTTIDARFPDGTPNQQLIEGMLLNNSSRVFGLTVIAENIRYPIHPDSGARAVGEIQTIEYCRFVHLGADGWGSPSAAGIGHHSGVQQHFELCILESQSQAAGFHTNADYDDKSLTTYQSTYHWTEDVDGNAVGMNSIGASQPSRAPLRNIVAERLISMGNSLDVREPRAELEAFAYDYVVDDTGGTPKVWISSCDYPLLELRSIDAVDSQVRLSGTAFVPLFGHGVHYADGGLRYPGRAYSWHRIDRRSTAEAPNPFIALGARLGDLSVTNLELTINFDDAVPVVSLILDEDYTAMTNQQVVDDLNAKLAAQMGAGLNGRAFYISTPYHNRAPFFQPDREGFAENETVSMIIKGDILAHTGTGVRLMEPADPVWMFAGIALDEARPTRPVRYQSSGLIHESHITGVPTGLAFGDTLAADVGGTVSTSGVAPILRLERRFGTRGDAFRLLTLN